jgi:hypothetical protein
VDVVARILKVEDEVLRRVIVRERERVRDVARADDDALRDRLAEDRDTRERARLRIELARDLCKLCL